MVEAQGGAKVRVTFVMEQQVGLKTYYENLRRFVDHDDRIIPTWGLIDYSKPGGLLEWMTFLPGGFTGTLRGRLQVRAALRKQADACLFLTQTPVSLGGRMSRRRPYVIMVDDTPILLDGMGEHYGLSAEKPGVMSLLKHRATALGLRGAHRVLPMSNWARRSLLDDYAVLSDRAVVVPTGIDLEAWTPGPKRADGPMRILFVGGQFDRKGGAVLLEAFDHLDRGSAELHVVTRSTLEPRPGVVVHYGVQPNSPEIIELYRSADVFVLPSLAEAFPNVVVESCASGLPTIVTDVGGMSEMVVDGETGYVIAPGDAGRLAEVLRLLVIDPATRARLGAAARVRAEAIFDGRKNAATVVDQLLEAVLS